MKFSHGFLALRASRALFSLMLMFASASAGATYDKSCVERLSRGWRAIPAMVAWHGQWEPVLQEFRKTSRPLDDLTFEALMDLSRGSFPLTAIFTDGKARTFLPGEMRGFLKILHKKDLLEVLHLQAANEKLSSLYKRACMLLNRGGCEIYDKYPGLGDEGSRPLTPLEELALKWCTFHMASPDSMARTMAQARRSGVSAAEIERNHGMGLESRLRSATDILLAVFQPEDARELFVNQVQPFLVSSFQRTLAKSRGHDLN